MTGLEDFKNKIGTGFKPLYLNILVIGGSTLLFLLAIQLMGDALELIGKDYARYIVNATSNPSIGLFIGLLSTAILQSSSTTTSMAVAAVAAGSLSLQNAIPIVMGANIGTTLTSTIVSMSYIIKTAEFRKAFTAGSVHDIFNVLIVLLIFPLEIKYGILSHTSQSLASLISVNSIDAPITEKFFLYKFFHEVGIGLISWFNPYIVLIVAIVLLFAIVKFISGLLYKKLIGNARAQFQSVVFDTPLRSFGWGFLLTSTIQSSSLTTSLIVPLAATSKVNMKRAFQFVMGANLGTTITALLAALFKSEAAVSLAIAHFLFNLSGVILFMAVPGLRNIPLYLADRIGSISLRWKLTAFAYVLLIFFILPFNLIFFSQQRNPAKSNISGEIYEALPANQNKLKCQFCLKPEH